MTKPHTQTFAYSFIGFFAAIIFYSVAAVQYFPAAQERYSSYAILSAGVGILLLIVGLIQWNRSHEIPKMEPGPTHNDTQSGVSESMVDFLELRDIPEDFFNNPEVLLVKSLLAKAWQQIEPRHRYRVGIPLEPWQMREVFSKYLVRVEVRERMLMLLPFHHILFRMLDQDPFPLTRKELRKMVKEGTKTVKSNTDNHDSWKLLASAHVFLDEMVESEDVIRKALEHDRSFSDGWYMLGGLLYGFERFVEADKVLGQAVRLDPSNKLLEKFHGRIRIKLLAEMAREESTDEDGIDIE